MSVLRTAIGSSLNVRLRTHEFMRILHMARLIIMLAALLTMALSASASQEGILPFSSFRLESAGIGSSGKIVVEGQQDSHDRLLSLTIAAFGKSYAVPKEKLAEIRDLPSNGIRISYEHGYAELGGRTVYIQLQMGFTSFTKKVALVTLTEDGEVEISPVQLLEDPMEKLAIPEEPHQASQPMPQGRRG